MLKSLGKWIYVHTALIVLMHVFSYTTRFSQTIQNLDSRFIDKTKNENAV
jgi:hypothetical protein